MMETEEDWGGGWESNPQRLESQSRTLPLSYRHHGRRAMHDETNRIARRLYRAPGRLQCCAPIIVLGSHVAISGNAQRITIASIMQNTYGIVPHITRVTGTSGAIELTM